MRLLLTISLLGWITLAQGESVRVLVQDSPLAGKHRQAAAIAFSIPPKYTLIANWSTIRRARWNVDEVTAGSGQARCPGLSSAGDGTASSGARRKEARA